MDFQLRVQNFTHSIFEFLAGFAIRHSDFLMHDLPGTYALILTANGEETIKIGKLGLFQARAGFYVYVGSAFGPGGLRARIGHHQRISNRPRWHIDYLRISAGIAEIWYTHDRAHREHQWAEILARERSAEIPLPRFGASDCTCKSHLFYFKSKPCGDYFRRRLHATHRNHDNVRIQPGAKRIHGKGALL